MITIDPSTPAILEGSVTGPTTPSNSFSPPANALLVVTGQYASNAGNAVSVSDTLGSHLSYHRLIEGATTSAYTSIWVADVPATPPGLMTVIITWNASQTGTSTACGVLVLTEAAVTLSQTGLTGTGTGTTGAPTASIASAAADSWVIGAICYKTGTAPTVPAGQTNTLNVNQQVVNTSVSKTFLWQGNNAPGNSNLTINDTAPTTVAWSVCVAEIKAGAAPPSPPTDDVGPGSVGVWDPTLNPMAWY